MTEALADIFEHAIDNVHDMDVTLRDYAEAAAKALPPAYRAGPALLAALDAIGGTPDGFCCCNRWRDARKAEGDHEDVCRETRATIAQARGKGGAG